LLRAEQPRRVSRAAAADGRACRQHRCGGHGAAPLQRAADLRSGVSHHCEDRHLIGSSDVERWTDYYQTIANGLRQMTVTDRSGTELAAGDAVARWVSMTHGTHAAGGYLYVIGNGGSAGMASHMAADACKNGHLRAMSFTDVALITAAANDIAYDQ